MEAQKTGISEDWLSLWLGLFIFLLGLGGFLGLDLLGWGVKTEMWSDLSKAFAPVSGALKGLPGITSLFLTYVFLVFLAVIGAGAMGVASGRFVLAFSLVFWISYACFLLGHQANIAANTPALMKKFNIDWSLRLTGEAGFIVALLAGLIVGNFFPGFAKVLEPAARPELYIKTAIVIMGAVVGVKAASALGLATAVLFRGLCAIVEAYLIYWAVVYFVARKWFKFSREWSAPLASGISICGVSAAIATGGAIRARPVVPIMVSSLVVIFAVVELLLLPFVAQVFMWQEPMVAGAWMGLAIKTDGAAMASGAIVDSLILSQAKNLAGITYDPGWIQMTATTVKIFIDVFIGIWAFILAVVWCAKIECKPGEKVRVGEIWERFPKFVIGYALTFGLMLWICMATGAKSELVKGAMVKNDALKLAENVTSGMDIFRGLFFVLTFFTIGLVSNFRKLWEEGIGRLAIVYIVCLFGFIIWVGLAISWIFFHGVTPPIIAG
jgi:uncharacterized membrane protein YadS